MYGLWYFREIKLISIDLLRLFLLRSEIVKVNWNLNFKKKNNFKTTNVPHPHCKNDCWCICGGNVQFVELICNYTLVFAGRILFNVSAHSTFFWLQTDTKIDNLLSAGRNAFSIDCFKHTHIKIGNPPFSFCLCFLFLFWI